MKIALAPMEGLVDPIMRDMLTRIGGIDYCVTEFIRISIRVLPARSFIKLCPELENGGCTPAGTPVHLQLLGSRPDMMAANARRAAKLGAPSIDLNFGCPSKGVNANRGGAILLETPNEIYDVVKAVRAAVPESTPVSAKMRLGYKDKSLVHENAAAIQEAGASFMTVHARTKAEGYRPPAHWEYIAAIKERVKIPVVANGEVWTPDDYRRCRDVSGCDDVMIGRGLVARPDLALAILADREGEGFIPILWPTIVERLLYLIAESEHRMQAGYVHGRVKQWLVHLKRHFPQADKLFHEVKKITDIEQLKRHLMSLELAEEKLVTVN